MTATAPGDIDPLLAGLRAAMPPGSRVHEQRWDPGRSARAAFTSPRPQDPPAEIIEVTPEGTLRSRLVDDAALPGLRPLLGRGSPDVRLPGVLGAPARHRSPVVVTSYHPGSRCVLRYDPPRAQRLYVKVLAQGPERPTGAARALSETARAWGQAPPVPVVVAVWPDVGAVVSQDVPGTSVSRALTDASHPRRLRLAADLGRLLAVVHLTPPGGVPGAPAVTAENVLAAAGVGIDAAWHADPVTAASYAAVLRDLAAQVPGESSPVLSHGSFRPGQVVEGRDGPTLLDLDSVCVADPGLDLGRALAHLLWQRLRGELAAGEGAALGDALVRAYEASGGVVDRSALRWWQAAAMLTIAGRRYRSVAVDQWPLVPALVAAAARVLDPAPVRSPRAGPPRSRAAPSVRSSDLLDAAGATALLGPVLAPHAAGGRAVVDGVVVVATAPGRRAVLRYHVRGLAGVERVIGKVYADPARALLTHENLLQMSRGVRGGDAAGVPAPLGTVPDRGLVLYPEAGGVPLHDLPGGSAVDASRRLGEWLAALHRGSAVLARRLDVAAETANARVWAQEVAQRRPGLREAALRTSDVLARRCRALPRCDEVVLHKDLHPGHVLVDDGVVRVIDVDEARMGDPAFDVAHLCTYLEELDEPWAAAATEAFLEAYGTVPGDGAPERLRFFGGYTRLKLAKQLVRGRPRPWASAAGTTDEAVLSLLTRGAACLVG